MRKFNFLRIKFKFMRNFFIFLLIIYSTTSIGQIKDKIDSLTTLINSSPDQKQKAKLLLKRSKVFAPTAITEAHNDAVFALDIAKIQNDKSTQIEVYNQLSSIFFIKENYQKASEFDKLALTLSEEENNLLGKIITYKSISRNQKSLGNIKEAIFSAEKAKEIATENKFVQELASINNALGVAYRNNNDYQKSLDVFNEGLNQTKNRKFIALLKMNKANTLTEMMRLDEAIINLLESLKINEELNDIKGIQQVYNNLGNLFKKAKQYEKAIYYFHKSLKIATVNNSKVATALSYDNIANVYDLINKKDSIIWYRKNAIALFEILNDQKNTARSYHNLGNFHLLNNQLKEAEQNLLIALQKRVQINVPIDIAATKTTLGVLYGKLKLFDKAECYLTDAKTLFKNVFSDKKEEFLQAFSNHYKLKGEFAKALKIKEQQLDLRDSLINNSEILSVLKQENNYVVKGQSKEIQRLQYVEENLSKSKIVYGILIFLVFIMALYSFTRWKKSDFNRKIILCEKQLIEAKHYTVIEELKNVKQLVIEDYLILKNNKKIYLNELEYIKSEDHYLELFVKSKKEVIRGTISEILLQLPPNFAQSHRSYIINKNYIVRRNTTNIVLKNNVVIPVSRKYKMGF